MLTRLPLIALALLSSAVTAQPVGTRDTAPFAYRVGEEWTGLAIELWEHIALEVGGPTDYVEMELADLIQATASGEVQVAVAALTITAEREEFLDFTHTYYTSGLGIAVKGEPSGPLAVVRSLLSVQLLTVVGVLGLLLFGVGGVMWAVERRRNAEQFPKGVKGLGEGFWWSAVTMTTVGYGDRAPVTGLGRAVAVVWMFASVIVISTFTAGIATALTLSGLESPVQGEDDLPGVRVGVIEASTSQAHLEVTGISPRRYTDLEALLEALRAGEIQAAVHDEAILRHAIRQVAPGEMQVLPEVILRQDYGFALPEGSPLLEPVNRALLAAIESPRWQDTLRTHLGE